MNFLHYLTIYVGDFFADDREKSANERVNAIT